MQNKKVNADVWRLNEVANTMVFITSSILSNKFVVQKISYLKG